MTYSCSFYIVDKINDVHGIDMMIDTLIFSQIFSNNWIGASLTYEVI